MGRLFWKFLIFIWLVQLLGMVGIGASFWLKDQARAEQGAQRSFESGGPFGPPSRNFMPPPKDMPDPHNRPPPPGPHLLPPPELIIANILGSLLSAALLAWYFSKPIRSLRSAFDAAAEGDLETRLGPTMGKRRDELADLSRDFDRMAERLQALMDSQRHLLHDVSHELRSPLARLQAAIGLARQKPEKLESTMDRLELESSRIDQLVGELLTLSRLEAGGLGTQEEVNMDELIADIVEDARFEAETQGRTVDFQGYADVIVQGRAELLGRAIENVVRNAIKHTPQGSWVLVKAEHNPSRHHLLLSIRDNGNGVSETDIDKIFDPFFRSGSNSGTDGHGLGLAIAQRVMQAHGGTISARNSAGGGLCVEMMFPVKRVDLP
jgi:two-component system OmpR family sensor kinase